MKTKRGFKALFSAEACELWSMRALAFVQVEALVNWLSKAEELVDYYNMYLETMMGYHDNVIYQNLFYPQEKESFLYDYFCKLELETIRRQMLLTRVFHKLVRS